MIASGPDRIIAALLGPPILACNSAGGRPVISGPNLAFCGTGCAIRAFASVNAEITMPFSLSSYLLGVGTVVGALAFGFGGGVLLTKTAMKDSPMAETRVERIKRADSPSTPQQPVEAKATPAPAEPPPPPGSAPQVQASTE